MLLRRRRHGTSSRTPKIELRDLVKEVVEQLKEARSTDGDAIIRLDSCDLELGVNVERDGNVGVKVYAFTLGASAKRSEQSTVTVRFKALDSVPSIAMAGEDQKIGLPVYFERVLRSPIAFVDPPKDGDGSSGT